MACVSSIFFVDLLHLGRSGLLIRAGRLQLAVLEAATRIYGLPGIEGRNISDFEVALERSASRLNMAFSPQIPGFDAIWDLGRRSGI
jgi:hypothetical protein